MNKPLLNSLVFISCEIFSKAMPFLLLPYLTRVLSVGDFGRLGLFTSFQALAIIFINISFDGAIARYYYRYGKRNFNNLIFNSFLCAILLTCLVFVTAKLLISDDVLILYAIVIALFQSLFNIISTSKQCQKKIFQYAAYQLMFSFLSVALTILLFKVISYNVFTRIEAIGIAFIICILAFLLFNLRYVKIKRFFSLHSFKINVLYLFAFGLPLIIHQSSLYLRGQFDRVLISHSFSLRDLATYTAAFQIASVANVFIMSLNKALVPYYFEACKKNKINQAIIKKWFLISTPISLIPGAIVFFIPGDFYTFILGSQYNNVALLVSLFIIGFGLQIPYLLIVNFLFYMNQTKKIAYATFSSSLVHLAILFILSKFTIQLLPLAMIASNISCLLLLYFLGIRGNGKN